MALSESTEHISLQTPQQQDEMQSSSTAIVVKPEPMTELHTPALFASYCATWTSTRGLTGLAIGTIVFAPRSPTPCRKRKPRAHYALAEITGLQRCSGTATISFLFSTPGVEDEAVALFDLIPCPPQWLHHATLEEEDGGACNLLERVLRLAPHAGPMTNSTEDFTLSALEQVYCQSEEDEAPPHTNTQEASSNNANTSSVKVEAVASIVEVEGRARLFFRYHSPATLNAFFGRAFRALDQLVERRWQHLTNNNTSSSPLLEQPTPVMLCVFDSFHLLQVFEVFMLLRGHIIHMLDGSKPPRGNQACQGLMPEPLYSAPIFSSTSKVWLCMLRVDVVINSSGHAERVGGCTTRRQESERLESEHIGIKQLLSTAPPVDLLVSVREVGGTQPSPPQHIGDAEAVLAAVLPQLAVEERCLSCDFGNLPGPNVPSEKVKVSGDIFGRNKVLVPPSTEQLLLAAIRLATRHRRTSPTSAGGEELALERIALGDLVDAETDFILRSLAGMRAMVVEDKAKVEVEAHGRGSSSCTRPMCSTSRFSRMWYGCEGFFFGEAFPVFAAVRAILDDVLHQWTTQRLRQVQDGAEEGRLPMFPRVALMLPGGNPAHKAELESRRFMHCLQEYLAPWRLFHVSADVPFGGGHHPGATSAVLWHRSGGIVILTCKELAGQLGALHLEADVVIACGASSAAWVAANTGRDAVEELHASPRVASPIFFAVVSELEITADEGGKHHWIHYVSPSQGSLIPADALGAAVARAEMHKIWHRLLAVAVEDKEQRIPRVPRQLLLLWKHLSEEEGGGRGTRPGVKRERDDATGEEERKVEPAVGATPAWCHLKAFVQSTVLKGLTVAPILLANVKLLGSD